MEGMNRVPLLLRWIGAVLLVAGLQAWGLQRQASPIIAVATEELGALRHEVTDNRRMNETLRSLQAYARATDDDLVRRQVLELRDAVLDRFGEDPAGSVAEIASVVAGFESRSGADGAPLAELRRHVMRLERMYTDHYRIAIDVVAHPAWYLQPTASFLNNDADRNRSLELNRAMYLALVREPGAAIEILDALRRESTDDAINARTLHVLARMQFDAYRGDKDPAHLQEALRLSRQAVVTDAHYELGKLFLDYLVSIDRQLVESDAEPAEGEGSGEGEGERGAIAVEPEEF